MNRVTKLKRRFVRKFYDFPRFITPRLARFWRCSPFSIHPKFELKVATRFSLKQFAALPLSYALPKQNGRTRTDNTQVKCSSNRIRYQKSYGDKVLMKHRALSI